MFRKRLPIAIVFQDFGLLYGISKQQLIIESFRLNTCGAAHYIANLRDRQYYYCGSDWEDVRAIFQAIGIGRPDPH